LVRGAVAVPYCALALSPPKKEPFESQALAGPAGLQAAREVELLTWHRREPRCKITTLSW